jgi:hypothetical protein
MNRPPRKPTGVLSEPLDLDSAPRRHAQTYRSVSVPAGTRVLHRPTGTRGKVRRILDDVVILEDAFGRERGVSRIPGGFAIEGETVTLVGVRPAAETAAAQRTASGSIRASDTRAKVAVGSRIWVEGDHDARLIERVWGDDLRDLAVVVEPLGGIDDLAAEVVRFGPTDGRRLGVLVDHLVPGSKETRICETVNDPNVLIVGHPYVDIWQCVRAKTLGISAWPEVERGHDWKTEICRQLGWGAPSDGWRRVLASVNGYADLDPALVGAVERLLDWLA